MSTTPTLRDAASSHIKQPYTLAEIRAKIASHDYSAELLLQHAMLLLEGAGAGEPVAWANMAQEEGEVYSVSLARDEYHNAALVLKSEAAQQLQQAVARAAEEAEKRMLDHISKVIWVERDRYVTLLGKCIAQGDKARADTYEQIARALDELHEGIQP